MAEHSKRNEILTTTAIYALAAGTLSWGLGRGLFQSGHWGEVAAAVTMIMGPLAAKRFPTDQRMHVVNASGIIGSMLTVGQQVYEHIANGTAGPDAPPLYAMAATMATINALSLTIPKKVDGNLLQKNPVACAAISKMLLTCPAMWLAGMAGQAPLLMATAGLWFVGFTAMATAQTSNLGQSRQPQP